jgi:hypothetical protein
MPETYAPPEQRQPFENFRPYRVSRVVDMSDGDADAHIVRDIPKQQTGQWRWTGQNPTVTVTLRAAENLNFTADFSVADVTFKSTGPIAITFLVNGKPLASVLYSAPGTYHFEKPVPAGWVEANKETTVGASVDKVWTSPNDGAKLGFILTRMGLTQAPAK